jgi:catechol 2,3-dioxygenase-like lactoylglutathione lyase family enzyme
MLEHCNEAVWIGSETMKLSHVNISMPKGGEDAARAFYTGHLGLREIPKPAVLLSRGGVWFDAGGLDIHLSIDESHAGQDAQRHFGLECPDVAALRARLTAAGIKIDDGRPAPWKRFFVRDPFGNRIEIHEAGGLRA